MAVADMQDMWKTMQTLQCATKKTFLRTSALGGLITLRLPEELQAMVMDNIKDILFHEIKTEMHKNDKMYLIINNDDHPQKAHSFVTSLNKQQAIAAELHINILPWTQERKDFGDVLFNFHWKHKTIIYEISSDLYDDIKLIIENL
jgi:hypothetical protein